MSLNLYFIEKLTPRSRVFNVHVVESWYYENTDRFPILLEIEIYS